MALEQLKLTVARVEIDGIPNGTAFLVDRHHVATALHVVGRHRQVELIFPNWSERDQTRCGTLMWRHTAAFDIAILELDKECPPNIEPIPWATPDPDDEWTAWGFPENVADGHTIVGKVRDPALRIRELDGQPVLQLETSSADYPLNGMSGSPCYCNRSDAIVGVITHQLCRILPDRELVVIPSPEEPAAKKAKSPSLRALYALPIVLLSEKLAPPAFRQFTPPKFAELIRMTDMLPPQAKASVLADVLRALDRAGAASREDLEQRTTIAGRLGAATRLAIHVVWRGGNGEAAALARAVYERMTRSALATTSPGLRIPTFLHDRTSFLSDAECLPIDLARVEHSVVVLLLDDPMFGDAEWRNCHDRIVEWSERDVAGMSLLPVSVDGPKRTEPFRDMLVSNFQGPASRHQLLIALEVHLLWALARRRSDSEDTDYARLFLSYASIDGRKVPEKVRNLARKIKGVDAVMDDSELGPGDRFDKLLDALADKVFLGFVTTRYTSRVWCRRELLEAKRLGRPIVLVQMHDGDIPRAFPYAGNVPFLEGPKVALDAHRILEAATFEALREKYTHLLLDDQTLLDASLRNARIVTRPPELYDLAGGGPLSDLPKDAPVVLHPDPPLPDEELGVLRRAVPNIRVVSPGLALAESRALRRPDGGASLRIALSASPPDLFRPGLVDLHFEDTWLDLIRMLLLGGATLATGTDLRPGGLTDVLLDVAEQRTQFERRAQQNSRARFKPPVLIHSYLAWPLHFALTYQRIAQLVDQVEFHQLPAPPAGLPTSPPPAVPPTTREERYLLARSLTMMRYTVLRNVDAMVVVGGKSTGAFGRYAGVVEEILLAIKQRKPVFVLGGLGGAAAEVADALFGRKPERLSASVQLQSHDEQDHIAYYNEMIRNAPDADDPELIDHGAVVETFNRAGSAKPGDPIDFAGLNNGLSKGENELLLTSPSMHEVMPLLMKGLRTLLGGVAAG